MYKPLLYMSTRRIKSPCTVSYVECSAIDIGQTRTAQYITNKKFNQNDHVLSFCV